VTGIYVEEVEWISSVAREGGTIPSIQSALSAFISWWHPLPSTEVEA